MAFLFFMNYYDEIKTEIEQALDSGNLEEARFLLKREFSMPYIPEDAEQQLRQLEGRLRYCEAEKREHGEQSMEHLLHQLKGRPASQLAAVNALADRNLRTIVPEIQDWLSKDPVPEAAAMMIELLAEQEIAEEFTIQKNGIEYTFHGDAVTPVTRSEGFRLALNCMNQWLGKEPSLLEIAKTVLVSRCYMALPLSYEAAEAKELALQSCLEAAEAMGMQELKEQLKGIAEQDETVRKFA